MMKRTQYEVTQFINELKSKSWEDLTTDMERKVYKELYPEYKTKKDRLADEIEFLCMLPIFMIVMPFIWLFKPRKK
jgi:hypothetical protein